MDAAANVGIRAFRQVLQDELAGICREHGWDYDNLTLRGCALQHWIASLFCQADPGIDADPDTAVLSSKDLGADVVLEDPTRQHIRIIQCKASSLKKESKLPPIDEKELNDFFNRHDHFMNRKWVREHGSEAAFVLLGDYKDKLQRGWTVEYFFVTTLNANERQQELVKAINHARQEAGSAVSCVLLDLAALKDFYNQALSVEQQIADRIRLTLPEDQYFIKFAPYKTLVAVIKGNALRALYGQHKERLFTYNIRDFLGKARAINKVMIGTAEDPKTSQSSSITIMVCPQSAPTSMSILMGSLRRRGCR
jgi:hypothetical protein